MLTKKHRLKTQKDFDFVYKNGKKFYSTDFLMIIVKQSSKNIPKQFDLPRFGFVASKKVGKAVSRNRAKRLLREAIRLELPKLTKDFDTVIVAFNSLPEKKITEIQQQVQDTFKKVGVYRA